MRLPTPPTRAPLLPLALALTLAGSAALALSPKDRSSPAVSSIVAQGGASEAKKPQERAVVRPDRSGVHFSVARRDLIEGRVVFMSSFVIRIYF